MKIGTGIIIFFLSLIALVAEILLYFFLGLGSVLSGDGATIPAIAVFFVCLMVFTAATGILAPLSALVELLAKKQNVSYYIMLPSLGVLAIALIAFAVVSTPAPRMMSSNPVPGGRSTDEKTGQGGAILQGDAWDRGEQTSPIDDSVATSFHRWAKNKVQGPFGRAETPALIVRCNSKSGPDVYVVTGMSSSVEWGTSSHTVRFRFDKDNPLIQRWNDSNDHKALFSPNPQDMIKRILSAKQLWFEFTPFEAAANATVQFGVNGLEPLLKSGGEDLGSLWASCGQTAVGPHAQVEDKRRRARKWPQAEEEARSWKTRANCEADGHVWRDGACHARR